MDVGMIVTFVDKLTRYQKNSKIYMQGPPVVSDFNTHQNQVKLIHILNNQIYICNLKNTTSNDRDVENLMKLKTLPKKFIDPQQRLILNSQVTL